MFCKCNGKRKNYPLAGWRIIRHEYTPKHYSRTANWDGLGQVELDAVKPEKLIALLDDAINEIFDQDLYDELIATEAEERELFQAELKRYVEEDL